MLHLTFEEYSELQKQDTGVCLACFELTTDIINTELHSTCPHCQAKQLMMLENALMYKKVVIEK